MSTNGGLNPADFPLTPLSVMKLHPRSHLGKYGWYACDKPEAVPDRNMRSDWRCPACVAAARVELRVYGDTAKEWRHTVDADPITVPLSWMVRRAEYWAGVTV